MNEMERIKQKVNRALDIPGILAVDHYFTNAYTAGPFPLGDNIVISLEVEPHHWHQIGARLDWFMDLDEDGLRAFFTQIKEGN